MLQSVKIGCQPIRGAWATKRAPTDSCVPQQSLCAFRALTSQPKQSDPAQQMLPGHLGSQFQCKILLYDTPKYEIKNPFRTSYSGASHFSFDRAATEGTYALQHIQASCQLEIPQSTPPCSEGSPQLLPQLKQNGRRYCL